MGRRTGLALLLLVRWAGAPGAAGAVPHALRTDECAFAHGVSLGTETIAASRQGSKEGCCAHCAATDACVAFSYLLDADDGADDCLLKGNALEQEAADGVVSGLSTRTTATRACQPPFAHFRWCDPSLPVSARVDALVAALRWEEKAALLTARQSPLGNISRLGLPEYDWGTNAMHGVQSRCGTRCPTTFPNPNALGATFNESLWGLVGGVIGVELRALWLQGVGENHGNNLPHIGLDVWSPSVNILRDPRWGRSMEVPSECPYANGQFAKAITEALQYGSDERFLRAAVTLKHWDAYSVERIGNVTRHNYDARVSKYDLAGTYFPAFKVAVKQAGARGVMCSYNSVNGVPACASTFLSAVLREHWGFEGYITSDSGAIEDIYTTHFPGMDPALGVSLAIKAGTDIDSSLDNGKDATGSPYMWHMDAALREGLISEADVDALLRRTLRLRFELGLLDPIHDQPYWHVPPDAVAAPRSVALSRDATRQAMTLLQNPGGLLPFNAAARGAVAVIGPHALAQLNLLGNYRGQICEGGLDDYSCVETPLEAIAERAAGRVVYARGCDVLGDATDGFAEALRAAARAERIVLLMGLSLELEAEYRDREDIALPGVQSQLAAEIVALGKPTAVVLLHGGAIGVDELVHRGGAAANRNVAIMSAGYPGRYGADGIADALFGIENVGGKLGATWYAKGAVDALDYLSMDMAAGPGRTYRYYTGRPLWPFGHGLSYTTFELERGAAQRRGHETSYSATLRNTGGRAGDEVVFAFFRPLDVRLPGGAPLVRKQLFGFRRVHLRAGAAREVSFVVSEAGEFASLALADADGNLVVAPGTYEILLSNGVDASVSWQHEVRAPAPRVVAPFPEAPLPEAARPALRGRGRGEERPAGEGAGLGLGLGLADA